MFETLSPGDKPIIRRSAEGAVKLGFTADTTNLKVGHPVKLKAGAVDTVTPVTAGTEFPFGIVVVPQSADGTKVTVLPFGGATEILAEADGTIAVGDRVSCTGFNATTGLGKYKVTGTFVCGVATSAASTGGEIVITLLSPSTR